MENELDFDIDVDNDYIVYRIEGDRLWDTRQAKFITDVPETACVMPLISAEGDNTERYLLDTLKFYGYGLGEFAENDPDTIKAQLAALDEKYLSMRTLAGLLANDPVALEKWQQHEAEAAPLREKLQSLTDTE